METCRFCGARLHAEATYCARCLAPIEVTEEEIAGALVEVDAAAGRWREPPRTGTPWQAGQRFISSHSPQVHSRWHAGALSFGPRVKIAATVFIVALPVIVWRILPLFALEFVFMWCAVVAPLALRDLWKRRRIR